MRTLLIDEFDMCRDGMKMLLQETFDAPEITEAGSLTEGLEFLSEDGFDLIMLGVDSPSQTATALIDALMASPASTGRRPAPVIVLGREFSLPVTSFAIENGVSACLIKMTPKKIAKHVLQLVMAGGRYFPSESLTDDTGETAICPVKFDRDACPLGQDMPLIAPQLTRRQIQVLKNIAQGKANKVIAREMNITAGTVKVHVASILKALNASNRTQAVNIATHMKLI